MKKKKINKGMKNYKTEETKDLERNNYKSKFENANNIYNILKNSLKTCLYNFNYETYTCKKLKPRKDMHFLILIFKSLTITVI